MVEGYDQPRQPDLKGQDGLSEIVLGFEVEADFKTLNVVINSWIADSMTAPPVDPVMKALQDLQEGQQQIFKKVREGQQDQQQTFKEVREGQQQIFKEVREGQQQIKSLHDVVNVGFASLHSDFEAYMDSDDSSDLEHVVCCIKSLREALEQQAASTEDCKAAVQTILDWKASTSVSDNSISPASGTSSITSHSCSAASSDYKNRSTSLRINQPFQRTQRALTQDSLAIERSLRCYGRFSFLIAMTRLDTTTS